MGCLSLNRTSPKPSKTRRPSSRPGSAFSRIWSHLIVKVTSLGRYWSYSHAMICWGMVGTCDVRHESFWCKAVISISHLTTPLPSITPPRSLPFIYLVVTSTSLYYNALNQVWWLSDSLEILPCSACSVRYLLQFAMSQLKSAVSWSVPSSSRFAHLLSQSC